MYITSRNGQRTAQREGAVVRGTWWGGGAVVVRACVCVYVSPLVCVLALRARAVGTVALGGARVARHCLGLPLSRPLAREVSLTRQQDRNL